MGSPFISREDLGAYLRRTFAASDSLALIAIDAACDMLRAKTEQQLDLVEDESIVIDGNGSDMLILPEMPVVDVTSVTVSEVALDSTADYYLDAKLGAIITRRRYRRWLTGRGIYTIVYSHGWAEIPADLRVLALTLAARIYDQGLVRQESVGGYQAVYAAVESLGFSDRENQIIAKYRRGGRS